MGYSLTSKSSHGSSNWAEIHSAAFMSGSQRQSVAAWLEIEKCRWGSIYCVLCPVLPMRPIKAPAATD